MGYAHTGVRIHSFIHLILTFCGGQKLTEQHDRKAIRQGNCERQRDPENQLEECRVKVP
jgi:hypothetical protein